jgi:hypothetical protein
MLIYLIFSAIFSFPAPPATPYETIFKEAFNSISETIGCNCTVVREGGGSSRVVIDTSPLEVHVVAMCPEKEETFYLVLPWRVNSWVFESTTRNEAYTC